MELGALLAQTDEIGKDHAIYYISRTLIGYELKYTPIKRVCLALLFSTQKLWHYMLNSKTNLITKINPLKYLLSKVALLGRTTKGVILLREFNAEYVDRKAIKG